MERLSQLQRSMPSPDYRCMHEIHPGKIPSNWEINHKCRPEKCPWLMTKADYDKWCKKHNVYFIGG